MQLQIIREQRGGSAAYATTLSNICEAALTGARIPPQLTLHVTKFGKGAKIKHF